jgi:hypothetical protein
MEDDVIGSPSKQPLQLRNARNSNRQPGAHQRLLCRWMVGQAELAFAMPTLTSMAIHMKEGI